MAPAPTNLAHEQAHTARRPPAVGLRNANPANRQRTALLNGATGRPEGGRGATAEQEWDRAAAIRAGVRDTTDNRPGRADRRRSVPTISCGAGFSSACDASYARVCADPCQSSSYPLNVSKQEVTSEAITGPPMRRTRSVAISQGRPQGRHPSARDQKRGPPRRIAPNRAACRGSRQPVLRIVPQGMLD